MDADQAATVFVEICTRLDELLATQRKTNDLLERLESVLQEHLDSPTGDGEESLAGSRPPRGLGHLIPYGGDNGHRITATAPDPDRQAT